MNLRQKIKKAKADLMAVENTHYDNSTWGIVEKFQKEQELQKVINHKCNFNRHYPWNEEYKIDWEKLTYISFHADFKQLGILKSSNGKPLSRKEVNEFLDEIIRTKFLQHAKKVSEEDANEETLKKRVDYFITVSNDRTKAKKLHVEKVYFQFKGDDKIYSYQKQEGDKK